MINITLNVDNHYFIIINDNKDIEIFELDIPCPFMNEETHGENSIHKVAEVNQKSKVGFIIPSFNKIKIKASYNELKFNVKKNSLLCGDDFIKIIMSATGTKYNE